MIWDLDLGLGFGTGLWLDNFPYLADPLPTLVKEFIDFCQAPVQVRSRSSPGPVQVQSESVSVSKDL